MKKAYTKVNYGIKLIINNLRMKDSRKIFYDKCVTH